MLAETFVMASFESKLLAGPLLLYAGVYFEREANGEVVLTRLSEWFANDNLVDSLGVVCENQIERIFQRAVGHLEGWLSNMPVYKVASQQLYKLFFGLVARLRSLYRPVFIPFEITQIEIPCHQKSAVDTVFRYGL